MPHENDMDLWLEDIVPRRKAGDFFNTIMISPVRAFTAGYPAK